MYKRFLIGGLIAVATGSVAAPADPVDVPDARLRHCLEQALGKDAGETITEEDMASLDRFSCDWRGGTVADISGLEFAVNLDYLALVGSDVSDLSPLADLASLTQLWLGAGAVEDVSPLAGLRSLTQLDIGDNELEDVSDLRRLTSLTYLGLYSNDIEDVSALRGMTSLADVRLNNNRISDISDLAANDGLGQGDYLDLLGNPLDDDAHATHIPALQERGVTVYFDPPPAAEISDRALRRCFEQALGKERGAAITESEMASLTSLTCRNAGVADLSGLEEAVSLTKLELDGNEIEDVDALGELDSLLYVGLRDNSIEDIEALADNRAFGDGDYIELRGNPLNAEAHSRHVPALERRGVTVSYDPSSPPVAIADARLRHCLEQALDKDAGATITEDDMASLDRFYCDSRGGTVADISGLEFAVNLDFLALPGSDVSDLSPLANLASLTQLSLGSGAVDDLSPLAGLRSLTHLGLASNEIEDVSDLRRLTSLTYLGLTDNEIEDISDLRRLTSLTFLGLALNDIEDVSALRGMTALNDVRLSDNRISDISDLAANDGLGRGDYLYLQRNPLDADAHATHIPALQERGVEVYFDPPTDPVVEISDRALRRCFEQALGKERGAAIAESEMASLTSLTCRNAGVADLSSLEEAVSLTKLELDGNEIEDVDALGELESLLYVGLRDNSIADIEALADNRDFGNGDYIELRGNPLNAEAHSRHIPALERRGVTVSYDPSSPPVSISDAALRQCLEEEFDKEAGATITEDDMASLDRLYCDGREGRVADISGLEFAVNLDFLSLPGSDVSDLSPLADLASLTQLWLGANAVDDLSPLAGLRSLTHLGLASNEIEDVSDLRRLTSLTYLGLTDNEIEDISDLRRLTSLTFLGLALNDIEDVSALRGMTALNDVRLSDNRISDISDLAANDGLGQGDHLDLLGNPLDSDAHATHIPALQERGVEVYFDPPDGVAISDRALRRCFEEALDKEQGAAITESEAASLTSLTCRNAGVVDLSGLEEAVSLTKLELDGNEIEDVDALGALESLLYVGLRDNSIADIEALADNRAFGDGDYLELRGNPLDAEAHSRHIPALERRGVTVSYDPPSPPVTISDAALRHCLEEELAKEAGATITEDDMASLERLFCNAYLLSDGSYNLVRSPHGPVASLSGLEFASSLVELRLRHNAVDDLSPLAELASLSVLNVRHNRVTDIAPLAELPLTYLNLSGNIIPDLSPLARIAPLTELTLVGSRVSDLSPLMELAHLTRLWLGANAIEDVSPLAGLRSLTQLDLGANAIEDVSSLGELTSLVYLGLYSNAIADVSALRAMTSLREAYLANNRISDISALVANDSLGEGDYVELQGNPIACGAQAEHVKLLRDRGVNVHADEADLALPVFAATPGNRFVELRWSKPAGCHVDRYQYRHGIGKSPEFGQWRNIGDGAATGRTVDDLANGQLHVFELRMVGARGPGPAKRVYVALAEEPDTPVEIVDAELSTALAEALGIGAESEQPADSAGQDQSGDGEGEEEAEAVVITRGQLATLTDLDIGSKGIANLRGLEYAVNLRSLSLAGNTVESLSPVAGLQLLATLDASANGISDVSSLTEESLPGLKALFLAANDLADISALRHLQGLTDLALDGNEIVDVTALTSLTALQRLWLNNNAIVDIAPLAANEGLGQGEVRLDGSSDYVDLRGNPLGTDALGVQAAQLRQRGAAVLADDGARLVPFFAQGGDPRRLSVLRIVNPTDQASEASLTAIDDAGLRLGPVTLVVGARRAVHLDSNDLENGNAELGLSAGVGTGTGDWRLELRSAAPLQLFSYMRGADGVTTSMNALAPETYAKHRVSMFKAAGLASRLRVINATGKAARVLIEGVDDAGATASVAVEVPIGATRNFTAATLEGGRGTGFGVLEGGLGNGVGDWRLTATSYDGVQVLNLLGSARGNWVNLSAEPSASDDDAEHLPLFLSEIASQGAHGQSVARIVNRSARSGQVTIRAVDAQGRAYPAGALALAAGRTVKFNSTELEQGDAERGLTGLTATGVDQRNWRLLLTSDLDIRASAYIEASDGLFGSFHECVSAAAATADAQQTHAVLLFNSAGHADGASRLRLINSAAAPANVRIRGLDDAGRPGVAVVRLAIPAGATRELTANDLETGEADGVSGALGDGGGKWRLRVESDAPIEVMNLVETASGHLSNLSR